MTHSAQGSFDVFQLPRRWARVAIASAVISVVLIGAFQSTTVNGQEADRIIIRGPAGSEQTDVRIGTERYGPIKATDTLWSIASQHRPHSSVDVPQMMSAIVQANPDAFRNNNPSEMLTGFYLRIPSLQEVQMMNPEAARRQIELGQQLERQQQILNEEQQLTNQRRREQEQLVRETRTRTEQAIGEVRARHEQEFIDLRESLLSSIQSTEMVFRDNEELKERLVRLENLLTALQEGVVTATEYEKEINELKAAQENLRREQEVVNARTQEKSMVEELLDHPAALALLASVPALLMILLTTWLLRRRQVDISEHALLTESAGGREPAEELSDEEARDALERELMGGITTEEDDLLSDDPFAGFDDDEGADLDRLSDEMLMPDMDTESEDDGFASDDFAELVEEPEADEQPEPATDVDTGEGLLGQDDLVQLLAGAKDGEETADDSDDVEDFDSDPEPSAELAEDENVDDIDALLDSVAAKSKAEQEEPALIDDDLLPEEPGEVDPFDPDVILDQVAKEPEEQSGSESDDDVEEADEEQADEEIDAADDIDIDELFNELGISYDDDDLSPDDIDLLLAEADDFDVDSIADTLDAVEDESVEHDLVFDDDDDDDDDEIVSEEELEQSLVDDEDNDEPINLTELDEGEVAFKANLDADEADTSDAEIDFKSYAAEEDLDEALFTLDDDELAQAAADAESELDSLFANDLDDIEKAEEAQTADEAENFLNIDDIIAEADNDSDAAADEDNDDDSSRAEDQLAAQLDLARAYLEMDEAENAREALQEVLNSDDEALRAEAEELLKRIVN